MIAAGSSTRTAQITGASGIKLNSYTKDTTITTYLYLNKTYSIDFGTSSGDKLYIKFNQSISSVTNSTLSWLSSKGNYNPPNLKIESSNMISIGGPTYSSIFERLSTISGGTFIVTVNGGNNYNNLTQTFTLNMYKNQSANNGTITM